MTRRPTTGETRRKVMLVGSSSYFLSGISYYTHRLALALDTTNDVSVVLMRRLIPTRLYPGRRRVGQTLAAFAYPPEMTVHDGIDWWGRGLGRAIALIVRERPCVLVLQWWTGAVLHNFLILAVAARAVRASVIIEFHEAQDTGEMAVRGAQGYVDRVFPLLLRLAAGVVVHSEFDRELVQSRLAVDRQVAEVIPHGPYDEGARPDPTVLRRADTGDREILWFGVIRPYKGLEDLVEAFDLLDAHEVANLRLTVVGETWEGWTRPIEAVAESRYASRISLVNRYVTDQELAGYLARAHAVALPYRRSSSSGPLAMAMAHGLPVIVSEVGGLVEAARDYEGAVFVAPGDVKALAEAIRAVVAETGEHHYTPPTSWDETEQGFARLFQRLQA